MMFILRALLSFEAADFDLPPDSVICQMTLEGGKSKSKGLE